VDQCETFHAERGQREDRRRASDDHREAAGTRLKAGLQHRVIRRATDIAAAGEGERYGVQRRCRQQLSGVVHQWRLGKGTDGIVGDHPIHHPTRGPRSIGA
jgi:hypothetical protein